MTDQDHDPHAVLHGMASGEHEDHPEVLAGADAGESVEEQLAKLDKRLTQRINDLRKDFDSTRKAISKSVGEFQSQITDLKTGVENNKASIEAQDASITNAVKKADAAHQLAEQAMTKTTQVESELETLHAEYQVHTHPVLMQLSGETNPPRAMGEGHE